MTTAQFGVGNGPVKRTVMITAKTEFQGENNFRLTNLAATTIVAVRPGGQSLRYRGV